MSIFTPQHICEAPELTLATPVGLPWLCPGCGRHFVVVANDEVGTWIAWYCLEDGNVRGDLPEVRN